MLTELAQNAAAKDVEIAKQHLEWVLKDIDDVGGFNMERSKEDLDRLIELHNQKARLEEIIENGGKLPEDEQGIVSRLCGGFFKTPFRCGL